MKKSKFYVICILFGVLAACTAKQEKTLSGLDPHNFEATVDELPVQLYTLTNKVGMEVCIKILVDVLCLSWCRTEMALCVMSCLVLTR